MLIRTGTFAGASVFLSRNLVAPEVYDSVHDALRLNGADVFLCSDPSRNGPDDYHVISDRTHEKFEDLKAKGCNVIGPHCVLFCAKERRALPKKGYICCLAMDGVKILTSGFEKDEKVWIEQIVTAMGGVLLSKTSLDVSFVIVKCVLAAKYKWALKVLKKPIVNVSWLNQCWTEHRLVPHECHRILPFTGLTICVTRFPLDERKKMEQMITQNGGLYNGDLTKKCTHLVSDAPGGDKYMVAKRWKHIHIVTRRWIDQSIATKDCLEERHFTVHGSCNSFSENKSFVREQQSQESVPLNHNGDFEACPFQKISSSTFSDATTAMKNEVPTVPTHDESAFRHCIAEDSEEEGNDMYLLKCRISLVGFDNAESRKLVGMIRKGAGTRHDILSERLTHVIVGSPSATERKELRQLATLGVIDMVKTNWLEDCTRARKELPVSSKHSASDLFSLNDSISYSRTRMDNIINGNKKNLAVQEEEFAFGNVGVKEAPELNILESNNSVLTAKSKQQFSTLPAINEHNNGHLLNTNSEDMPSQRRCTNIFKGHSFCFSKSFPEDRRIDIIEWVGEGGGVIIDDNKNARFIIECHGLLSNQAKVGRSTEVSSHWIRSCLEEGCIQDVHSHILYTPLPCQVPLPGFAGIRFCVSQYETKEKQLLRNLCFTLGSKCTEKLTKRVTHLLCKIKSGPKYDAACKWGIQSTTADWITECVRQNTMVPLDEFRPKEVTSQDIEAGLYTTTQGPTVADGLISEETQSQLLSGCQRTTLKQKSEYPTILRKRCLEDGFHDNLSKTKKLKNRAETSDVATVIEDFLQKSDMVQDQKSPDNNGCKRNSFPPDSILNQDHAAPDTSLRIPKHWSDRSESYIKPTTFNHDDRPRTYDGFSETQTESQVVGYEEDLSGRQKIIERVRSQSLTSDTSPSPSTSMFPRNF